MVAPIKYLSGRQQQQKLGIEGDSENKKVLEVLGQVGIGTTVFDTSNSLEVHGDIYHVGDLNITGQINQVNVEALTTTKTLGVTGVSTFQNNIHIHSDKNIGLGVESPTNSIHIEANLPTIRLTNKLSNNSNSGQIEFREKDSDDSIGAYIRHDGSDNLFKIGTIHDSDSNDGIQIGRNNHEVRLYHNGSQKLETVSTGVTVTGNLKTQSLTVTSGAAFTDAVTFYNNVHLGATTSVTISGPENIIIDPSPVGVGTTSGNVYIKGDLFVQGRNLQVDSTTVNIADKVIGIATTCTDNTLLDGAGLGIGTDGNRKTILYHNASTSLKSSENFNIASGKVYQIDQTERLSADTLNLGTGANIHSPTSNTLTFETNSQERVRVTSVGNIGFAANNPINLVQIGEHNKLDIKVSTAGTVAIGTDRITGISTSGIETGFIVQSTTSGILRENTIVESIGENIVGLGTTTLLAASDETFNFVLFDDDSDAITFTSDGSLAVGSTNPSAKLDVIGSAEFDGLNVDGSTTLDATTIDGLLDANSGLQADTAKIEDLTDNRVVIAGTDGELEDDANLTFDGSQLYIGTALSVTGISTFEEKINASSDLDVDGLSTLDELSVSGISTFNGDDIIVLVGTSSPTGTTNQKLQVDSGAYFSGSLGIGETNPTGTEIFKTVVSAAGTVAAPVAGVSTDIITGISTLSITPGLVINEISGIIAAGTTVQTVGINEVGLGRTTINTTLREDVVFDFGNTALSGDNIKLFVDGDGYVSGSLNVVGVVTAQRIFSTVHGEFTGGTVTATQTAFDYQRVGGISTITRLNVNGIGATLGVTPGLDVDEESNFSKQIIVGVNTSDPALKITQTGAGDLLLVNSEDNDTTPFVINTNNSVGIGTTNPTTGLDIDVNVHVSSASTFSENVVIDKNITTNTLGINTTTIYGSAVGIAETTDPVGIHSELSIATYRSVEYTIQATESTNYHTTKVLALHNGTDAFYSEYGVVFNSNSVASFDVDVSGGNIRLVATASTSSTTNYSINYVATKL